MRVLALVVSLLLAGPATAAAGAIRIGMFDDTESKPLPSGQGDARAQVWAKGVGSKPFPEAAPLDIPAETNAVASISIYPDGRNGNEIAVSLKLTAEMCQGGCARDMVQISISDENVKVFGAPVKAQHGKLELEFNR
jgi:hypothetical protein